MEDPMLNGEVRKRLARMERRQEALVQAIDGLANVITINNAMLTELMEWMKQPPSSELPDLIKALIAMVSEMPAKVAKAVLDGELDTRG